MSEPEDVLLDGAHHATLFVQGLWRRRSGTQDPDTVRLLEVRSRLELFVRAAFEIPLEVGIAEPPAVPNLFSRLGRRIPRHLVERRTLSSTDGVRLRLPRTLPESAVPGGGMGRYRVLAAAGAVRARRLTPEHLPAEELLRDLFLIREAVAATATLEREFPGLVPALRLAREEDLAFRPPEAVLTPWERAVEMALQAALAGEMDAGSSVHEPADSLDWATDAARRIRKMTGRYRGLPGVASWGLVAAPPPPPEHRTAGPPAEDEEPGLRRRVSRMQRRPRIRQPDDDEDDSDPGIWMIQLDDPQEHVEDPMGLQRPTDRDDEVDPDELADSLSELPEARLVTVPGRPREVLASDDPPPATMAEAADGGRRQGMVYPEWDYRTRTYRPDGAVVQLRTPGPGSAAWAQDVLTRRAALLHRVRRRFERLRPRRHRVGRQLDGPEVDLAAYVESYADRMAGAGTDDRLYQAVIPARRDLAIVLLVDVSGSTDSWITEDLRVVDVEKEALLVVCHALEALGDPYAILSFSGEGPGCVSLGQVKGFDERSDSVVWRRIAGLEPDRYTRMGAALRHATHILMGKPVRHRLLLVLSDGKPNDVDRYEGRYGVEDSRQAVAEARLQGLHPFCVTVDRQAPAYMPRVFGAGGYAVLHHPEHLSGVLVDVIRRLVRA